MRLPRGRRPGTCRGFRYKVGTRWVPAPGRAGQSQGGGRGVAEQRADPNSHNDRQILLTAAVCFAIFTPILVLTSAFAQSLDLTEILSDVLGGFALSFFATGFLAVHQHRRRGLLRPASVWKWAFLGALVLALILFLLFLVVLFVLPSLPGVPSLPRNDILVLSPVLLAVLFPVGLALVLAAWTLGMGVVGTMSAIARRMAPWILSQMAAARPGSDLSPTQRFLLWLFAVPEVLDPSSLRVAGRAPRTTIRWNDLGPAVAWQLLFGIVLAMYVSLNPFVADESPATLLRIFGILTAGAIFLPVLVLPWFLYAALGAKIDGGVKDFYLFDGMRAR